MLQRDYILRLIREFMMALQRVLEKDVESRREELKQLYEQYVGSYDCYHNATVEEALDELSAYDEGERIERTAMLAELYLAEAETESEPLHSDLLLRAFALFDLIDRNSKTYDLSRKAKMKRIHDELGGSAVEGQVKT